MKMRSLLNKENKRTLQVHFKNRNSCHRVRLLIKRKEYFVNDTNIFIIYKKISFSGV